MLKTSTEPHIARFTSDKAMIKDHYYYKGTSFSWNKPARINEKHYPYFHKQQDENKARVDSMKQQELEDKKIIEEMRRENFIEKKAQDKIHYESRIREREVIQRMSNQPIQSQSNLETEDDSKVVYEIVAKRLNSGKDLRSDEFVWNLLNRASKKNVEIYLGSYSLKGEEDMIKKLKERLEEEKVKDMDEQRRKSEVHQKLRSIFVARHEENLAKEENILRPATAKNPNFQIRKSAFQHPNGSRHIDVTSKRESCASITDLKPANHPVTPRSQEKEIKASLAISVERLAASREGVRREFKIDNTECKGMLVKNMDKRICYPGNNFYDALTQSKVFQEVLDGNKSSEKPNSSRKVFQYRPASSITHSTLQSRPMTSHSKIISPLNQYSPSVNLNSGAVSPTSKNKIEIRSMSVAENENYDAIQEIRAFENVFCRNGKKVGYARVSLEEAYRLASTQGIMALKRAETKKYQSVK